MSSNPKARLLEWDDAYAVKIRVFDEHHKHLFGLVRKLQQANRSGANDADIRRVLSLLIRYTMTHFQAEEAAMEGYGYPDLDIHRQEHQKLTDSVLDFAKRHHEGSPTYYAELLEFLQDWLQQHVLHSDRNYSRYLRERGLK